MEERGRLPSGPGVRAYVRTVKPSSTEPYFDRRYVTREELEDFQRSVSQLLWLFLEFYVTAAIELETSYIDIYLN